MSGTGRQPAIPIEHTTLLDKRDVIDLGERISKLQQTLADADRHRQSEHRMNLQLAERYERLATEQTKATSEQTTAIKALTVAVERLATLLNPFAKETGHG